MESVAVFGERVVATPREVARGSAKKAPLRAAIVVSVVFHGALVAGALTLPARAAVDEAPLVVDIVAPVVEEPPVAAPPPPEPLRPMPVKLARAQVRPTLAAAPPVPPPPAPPTDEPPPEAPAAAVPEAGNETGDLPLPAGPAGKGTGTAPGSPNGVPGGKGAVVPPAPPTEAQRKSLIDGYLADMFRTRIAQNFRYPDAARELELTGQVIVQITVDRQGRLVAAPRLVGRCPHALLCEDGLRTLRASAPFPPLPPGLGDAVRFEVPLKYDF
jgi:protein TonB